MADALANPEAARSLADCLAEGHAWSVGDSLVLTRELALQVQTLHQSGRTHRAIGGETVTLAGPRRAALGPAPAVRPFGGEDSAPEFCPPELAGGEALELPAEIESAAVILRQHGSEFDPRRIDLYQLGVLLCQLVTGEPVLGYLYSPTVKAQVPAVVRTVLARALGDAPGPFADCEALLAGLDEAIHQADAVETPTTMDETPAQGSMVWPGGDTPRSGNPPAPAPKATGPLPFERLGHYRIIARIGHGGMGDVYQGYDESLDRYVAIKVLPPEFARDEDFVRRFHAEATAAARIAHPNVVPVYFSGEDAGHHFFAMQFIEGESLSQRLACKRRLPLAETLSIAEHCLAGLEAAHAEGLIHRDIKPGNILLDRRSGRAVVVDFGLVRMVGQSAQMTATGVVMGTVDYIAPEQARGLKVDARADIYSLGVLLYQLLAGRLPFTADTPTAMVFQHAYEEPYPLLEAAPDVPPAVAAIIGRMMAKRPEDRYVSCAELLADIRAFRQNSPLPPGEAPRGYPGVRAAFGEQQPADEMEPSAGSLALPAPAPTGLWQRAQDWAATMFRRHAPQAIQDLQTTTQQVDSAVAEYERRRRRLAKLVEEGRGILVELAGQIGTNPSEENAVCLRKQHEEQQRQVEDLELQLAKADATLAQLRSQHDLLEARLKAAQAQHAPEADRPRSSRRHVTVATVALCATLAFGSLLLLSKLALSPAVAPFDAASRGEKVVAEVRHGAAKEAPPAASRPLTVALYGLGGEVAMEPTQFPPEWKTPGEFAWIGAPGRMTFPTLPVSDYAMETELTFRKVGNGHIDYELGHPIAGKTSVALGCLWPQDQNATGVPCRLFHANRGGANWDGEEHFPVGQRLRLKLVAAGHNRALFYNGGRVLNALAFPMDTTLTILAFGGVDCTIHACTLRELRAEDVAGLGWTAPQRTLDLKPEMAAARIDKQTGALGEHPEPSKAFLVKSIGAPMSWAPPGEFDMGSEAPHAVWGGIEGAAGGKHRVRLTRGFWMGRYEVTQQQWMKLSHSNPSRIQGSPYLPVNWISWQEAVDFCAKLHQKEKQAGRVPEGFQYRLPTEAEWEYACRTGMDEVKELDQKQFWFAENSENRLHEVGEWPANRWGLYDMLGNVEEWCFDVWQPYQAQSGIVLEDPFELSAGKDDWFPVRGGAWWSWQYRHPWAKYTSDATLCTWRNCSPSIAGAYRGFRLVLGRNLGEIAVPGRK
jgi:serine/threonine protein kinase/formylglycine-generating enzyme required for sulfatase activity